MSGNTKYYEGHQVPLSFNPDTDLLLDNGATVQLVKPPHPRRVKNVKKLLQIRILIYPFLKIIYKKRPRKLKKKLRKAQGLTAKRNAEKRLILHVLIGKVNQETVKKAFDKFLREGGVITEVTKDGTELL